MQCVWVLDASCTNVLWSRRFPTVIARAGAELPDAEALATLLCSALASHRAESASPLPVLHCAPLAPMVFAESTLGLVVGLSSAKGKGEALLEAPEVLVALETVSQLATFLESQMQHASIGAGFWAAVSACVSIAMPFGTLVRPFHVGEALAMSGMSSPPPTDSAVGGAASGGGSGGAQGDLDTGVRESC